MTTAQLESAESNINVDKVKLRMRNGLQRARRASRAQGLCASPSSPIISH